MKKIKLNKRAIIWDFDGVIINSLPIRDASFKYALSEYSEELVEKMIKYHKKNSGQSRFKKIKFFFNELLDKEISNEEINAYASKISKYVKDKLEPSMIDSELLNWIKNNSNDIDMHIVSASLDIELKYICNKLGITPYFKTITGSQNILSTKTITATNIINIFGYDKDETLFVGDSVNDWKAAMNIGVEFCKYNFRNDKDVNNKNIALIKSNNNFTFYKEI